MMEGQFYFECAECGETITQEYEKHCCKRNEIQEQASEDNLIGRLAEAVQTRRPLWDHTLALKLRSKEIKEKLWREVCNELDGQIPLDQIERKWKNLRDTFLKHFRTYTSSGSGTEDKKKWKHFDNLLFLGEINLSKKGIGNIKERIPSTSKTPDLMSPTTSPIDFSEYTPSVKRQRKSKDDSERQLLINILKEPPPAIPAQPQLSPALLTIQSILEKLPTRIRLKAEIEMLNKVYSLNDEYGKD